MELYLIKYLLDQSLEEGKIYRFEGYKDSFDYCGIVLSYNTDTIQIQHFTKYGEPDGIYFLPLNKIQKIYIDSKYLNTIQYLIKNQDEFVAMHRNHQFRLASGTEGLLPILNDCLNNRDIVVTIETDSESYYGFVDAVIGTSLFVFTEIFLNDSKTDTSIHKIEDVESINVNEKHACRFLLLYNLHRKNKI